jgi:hypothetical protein
MPGRGQGCGMTETPPTTLVARTPEDLLAMVPIVIGFALFWTTDPGWPIGSAGLRADVGGA